MEVCALECVLRLFSSSWYHHDVAHARVATASLTQQQHVLNINNMFVGSNLHQPAMLSLFSGLPPGYVVRARTQDGAAATRSGRVTAAASGVQGRPAPGQGHRHRLRTPGPGARETQLGRL